MATTNALEADYNRLFVEHGLKKIDGKLDHPIELIAEERKSAEDQGVPDFDLDGRSDEEVVRMRLEQQAGRSTLQTALDELVLEIEGAAKKLNFHLPMDVFTGEFPTNSFNAQVSASDNGALILIYDELLVFVYSCVKVFVLGTPINLVDTEKIYRTIEPAITAQQSVEVLADIVRSYLRKGTSALADRLPAQGSARGALCDELTISILRFAVAHEYGHVLGGHCNHSSQAVANLPTGKLRFVVKNWEKETVADQYGFDLCLAPIWPCFGSREKELELALRLAGPFGFFALARLLESASKANAQIAIDHPVFTTHPPPETRAISMRAWFDQLSGDRADYILSGGFAEWLNSKIADVYLLFDEGNIGLSDETTDDG